MDKIKYDSLILRVGSLDIKVTPGEATIFIIEERGESYLDVKFKMHGKPLVTTFIEMLYGSKELELLYFDNHLLVKKCKANIKNYTYCFDKDYVMLRCDNVEEIKYNYIDLKIGDVNISLDYKENSEFFDSFYDNSNRAKLKLYDDKAMLVDEEFSKGNREFEITYITSYGAVRKCKGIIMEYNAYFTSYEYVATINLYIEGKECNNYKLTESINMDKKDISFTIGHLDIKVDPKDWIVFTNNNQDDYIKAELILYNEKALLVDNEIVLSDIKKQAGFPCVIEYDGCKKRYWEIIKYMPSFTRDGDKAKIKLHMVKNFK